MGVEFQEAIGSTEWDVLTHTSVEDGVRDDNRLGLFHHHVVGGASTKMLFWVNEDRCCRVCGVRAPDFIWFRYKTWKLRFLTQ